MKRSVRVGWVGLKQWHFLVTPGLEGMVVIAEQYKYKVERFRLYCICRSMFALKESVFWMSRAVYILMPSCWLS